MFKVTYHRTATDANCTPGHPLCHALGLQGVVDPRRIKGKGTFSHAFFTITICVHTCVTTMGQLEQLVLALVVGTCITNTRNAQLSILDAVILCTAFAKCATVRSNDGGVPCRKK